MPTPAPLASHTDLETRLGVTLDGHQEQAEALLVDISEQVRFEGDPTWTAESAPGPVISIVLAVARRVWRNPDGLNAETIPGGFSRGWAVSAVGPDMMYLTDKELAIVRRLAGKSGLRSVQVTRDGCGDWEDQLVDVAGSSSEDPILYYSERDLDELGWTSDS